MGDGLGFLTAVYRDGRVHIGGKATRQAPLRFIF